MMLLTPRLPGKLNMVRHGSRRGMRHAARAQSGFTLIELMAATLLTSIVLVGVYGVFFQTMSVASRISERWQQKAASYAVADELAQTIERLIILPEIPPLKGGPVVDGRGYELTCTTAGQWAAGGDPRSAASHYRYYRWGLDGEQTGQLILQERSMAGGRDITLSSQADELSPAGQWALVPPMVIAENVDEISITYRPVDAINSEWSDSWSATGQPVMVRIRVTVGSQVTERLVAPFVRAALVEEEGAQ